jgi:hypothetical protein
VPDKPDDIRPLPPQRDQQDIHWFIAFRNQSAWMTGSFEADFIAIAFKEIRTARSDTATYRYPGRLNMTNALVVGTSYRTGSTL